MKHGGAPTVFPQRTRPCPGIEFLASRHFPEDFQGNLLVPNVIGFQGILRYKVEDKDSTLTALRISVEWLRPGGLITIVVYPNHEGGDSEASAVAEWACALSPKRRVWAGAHLGPRLARRSSGSMPGGGSRPRSRPGRSSVSWRWPSWPRWSYFAKSRTGMVSPPGMEPYCATKFAVVAMSEGWAAQMVPLDIGVSVLCPGFVKTRIHESGRARQDKYGGTGDVDPGVGATRAEAASNVLNGIDPDIVGQRVVEGVRDNDLYIFTHPHFKDFVQARFAAILAAFDKSAASEALTQVKNWQPVTPRRYD